MIQHNNTISSKSPDMIGYPISDLISRGNGCLIALKDLHQSPQENHLDPECVRTLLKAKPQINQEEYTRIKESIVLMSKGMEGDTRKNIQHSISELIAYGIEIETLESIGKLSEYGEIGPYYKFLVDKLKEYERLGLNKKQIKNFAQVMLAYLEKTQTLSIQATHFHAALDCLTSPIFMAEPTIIEPSELINSDPESFDQRFNLLLLALETVLGSKKYVMGAERLEMPLQTFLMSFPAMVFNRELSSDQIDSFSDFIREISSVEYILTRLKLIRLRRNLLENEGVFNKVFFNITNRIKALANLAHDNNKLDVESWYEYGLAAAANLELIAPPVHNALVDQFLTQRKNALMYFQTVAPYRQLGNRSIKELTTFYKENKRLFGDHQQLFLRVIEYEQLGNQMGVSLLRDLNTKEISNADQLIERLGQELIRLLIQQLGTNIDLEKIDRKTVLQKWDFRYFGQLVQSQASWDPESRDLFKCLLELAFDNRLDLMFSQTNHSRLDSLNPEQVRHISRINASYDSFVDEMTDLGLDAEKWLNAHTVVPERNCKIQISDNESNLLEDFRNNFTALNDYLDSSVSHEARCEWDEISSSEQLESLMSQETKEISKAAASYFKDIFKPFLSSLDQEEAVIDMQLCVDRIVERMSQLDSGRKNKVHSVAFWDPLDLGHNIFAGNRANSCTALGKSASMIFGFVTDPGTKYIYTKDSKGNITGYARVFLILNEGEDPKIYIDSVDGKAGVKRDWQSPIEPIMSMLKKLALDIGLEETDVIYRKSVSDAVKIGEYSGSYFSHIKLNKTDELKRRAASVRTPLVHSV